MLAYPFSYRPDNVHFLKLLFCYCKTFVSLQLVMVSSEWAVVSVESVMFFILTTHYKVGLCHSLPASETL